MWKKDEAPEPVTFSRPDPIPYPEPVAPTRGAPVERATIGKSITIRGEVTGDEDLLIQGRIDGSVNLKQHAVTVGREGHVKADIFGRVITVEGQVEGNLTAEEQVVLRGSGALQGNITAPRVVLEDGARFRGGVDMGESLKAGSSRAAVSSAPQAARVAEGSTRPVTATPAEPQKSASVAKTDGAPLKPAGMP